MYLLNFLQSLRLCSSRVRSNRNVSGSVLTRLEASRSVERACGPHRTSQVELVGARATLISAPGRGVAAISAMLNVTRVYNAAAATGAMARALAKAEQFACAREAFGARLADLPLHAETLLTLRCPHPRGKERAVFEKFSGILERLR